MAGIDCLNHVLRVRTIIRSDYGRGLGCLFGKNGWRKGKRMEISAFSYDRRRRVSSMSGCPKKNAEPTDGGVLEDNQEARIIDPLDLKPPADVFPLYKGGLDIPRLQLLWEAGKRKNTCDASRELSE